MRNLLNRLHKLIKYLKSYVGRKPPKFSHKKKGFLHIGKTSGSSLLGLFTELDQKDSYRVPMWFGHDWKLRHIIKYYPNIKISIILRDPIKRAFSGFYSVLNRKPEDWENNEAICFSYFSNANEYFQSCLMPTDNLKRRLADYVTKNIRHIKRGYEYYFEDVDFLKKNLDRFYFIGDFDDLRNSTRKIIDEINDFDEKFDNFFLHKRKNVFRDKVDENIDTKKLQKYFAKEYEIFNFLNDKKSEINVKKN